MTRELAIGLKPVWLLGIGAFGGLILVALIWLLLLLFHRRAAATMRDILGEKVVFPVLVAAAVLSVFSIGMTISDAMGGRFFDRKADSLWSVTRLLSVGPKAQVAEITANAKDRNILLNVHNGELKELAIASDQPVTVTVNRPATEADIAKGERFEVLPNEPFSWKRGREAGGPLAGELQSLFVTNDGAMAATLNVTTQTQPPVPEARVIPYTAFGLLAYVGVFLLLQSLFPKVAAVALTTGKEAVSQPLFRLTMALGSFLVLVLVILPYFTFGDDVKMYKDAGLQIIMLLAMFVAIWTSSVAVADEIEGRTALTVLSKPIGRQQFIIGKFVGIATALGLMFMLLGALLVVCVSYKVAYDARESANYYITWQDCNVELMRTVPGLVLGFMEACVLASISVAISTRLSIMANMIICMAIYVVGHLLPLFVQSSVGEFAIVQFMGQLFATVLPVLEYFNIYAAIAAGQDVPMTYLLWVGGYTLMYITIAMLLALALFDDRDLA